jgi:predicted dehydrogenase
MRNFISQPDVRIVALCDVEQAQGSRTGLPDAVKMAVEHSAKVGRPVEADSLALTGDFRELLARGDVDAVSISTPDHWHGPIAVAAARSGKDIYCEKPLTNSIPEGRAVCDAVARYCRVLQTGSHERSNDTCRYAWELVNNGRIGALKEVEVRLPTDQAHHNAIREAKGPYTPSAPPASLDYEMWLGPIPWRPYIPDNTHFGWRFVMDTGGGEMTDRGAHVLDLVQFIINADASGPVEVSALGTQADSPIFDAFMDFEFECRYADGLRVRGTSEGDRGLKLIGEDGWIFINIHGGRLEASDPAILRERIRPSERHAERSPGHHRNFLDCVKSRRRPIAHEEIGHRTGTICHLLNTSMLLRRPIRWDPVRESVVGDVEAVRLLSRPMRTPWHV